MSLRPLLTERADLLRRIRLFFSSRDVLEVSTPVLGQASGTDPALQPFVTHFEGPGHATGLPLYLQTSPELHMKRLLAEGSGAIYQVAPAFRNGEHGRKHNPEFTLLEWYRPGFDHHQLMQEVADLVGEALQQSLSVEKWRYAELIEQQVGIDPLSATAAQLRQRALGLGITGIEDLSLDKDGWLDMLMSHLIEPKLGQGHLSFVYDYPASQAVLARLNPLDSRVASRFELYYQGIELANGFHELADAEEQLKRFEQDNQARTARGMPQLPIDDHFIQALRSPGLPDCAGVALGLDRLLMIRLGASDLAQVMPFTLPTC